MANPVKSSAKILLADDSVTMHRAVGLGLKKEPFEILYCDNGQDALRITKEQRPLIVLADLDMPGLTGAELCKAIKEDPELAADSKVILLCGSFDQVDEKELEAIPADARLWKPFESHVLVSMIHTLLKVPPKIPQEATQQMARPEAAKSTQEMEGQDPTAAYTQGIQRPPIENANEATEVNIEKAFAAPPPPPPPPKRENPTIDLDQNLGEEIVDNSKPEMLDGATQQFETPIMEDGVKDEGTEAFSPFPELPESSEEKVSDDLWNSEVELSSTPSESAGSIEENFLPEKSSDDANEFEIISNTMSGILPPQEDIVEISSSAIGERIQNAPSVSKSEVAEMVHEEVERALNGYFKEKLESRLQDILDMIQMRSRS